MDKDTRNAIQRSTQRARDLLEREIGEQLEGTYDIRLDGTIAEEPGSHLSDSERMTREKLVAAVEHFTSFGRTRSEAVADYQREAAFTTLNRFVALKMLEARALVQECVSKGDQSAGFKEFGGLAPGLSQLPDQGYRLYLESVFDEIGQEVGILFDRRDPSDLIWPLLGAVEVLVDPADRLVVVPHAGERRRVEDLEQLVERLAARPEQARRDRGGRRGSDLLADLVEEALEVEAVALVGELESPGARPQNSLKPATGRRARRTPGRARAPRASSARRTG